MTAHAHDHGSEDAVRPRTIRRPRWLVPAVGVGVVAGGLVLAGVIPLTTMIYAGLFGGMLLMHLGGHGGHGGHGAHDGPGGLGGASRSAPGDAVRNGSGHADGADLDRADADQAAAANPPRTGSCH